MHFYYEKKERFPAVVFAFFGSFDLSCLLYLYLFSVILNCYRENWIF